jgi:hypothetical protein
MKTEGANGFPKSGATQREHGGARIAAPFAHLVESK